MADDLEDSLKRLFQDSRLDMRVAPAAAEKVVRGARRVRRRRVALISSVGVMSLAVLAGGTFLLARPAPQPTEVATQPTDLPITTTTTTAPTELATVAPPPPTLAPTSTTKVQEPATSRPAAELPAAPTGRTDLGPTGFGGYQLGMTESQLGATGQAPEATPAGQSSCVTYRIKGMPDASTLTVSKRYGLVTITLSADATTPQGITIGSTEDQVRATYRTTPATVPQNPNAEYRFRFTAGKVSEITLAAKTSDCPA
jgi:hypothetical protein